MAFLKLLVFLLFLAAIAGVMLPGFKKKKVDDGRFPYMFHAAGIRVTLSVVLLLLCSLINASFGQVPAGYRGIVLQFGAPTGRILREGFYTVWPPFIKTVELMNVQIQAYETQAGAASKDLQTANTKVTLNFAIEPTSVVKVYQDLRQEIIPRIISPAVQEAVKASTATYTAEELITKRPAVKETIDQNLLDRLTKFGLRIEQLSITDFRFDPQFEAAIEAKVAATQQALKAQRDLERIKLEAQQKIASAQAEAESLRLQKANTTPEVLQLRAIEKWDGVMPQIMGGSNMMFNIPMPQKTR